MLVIKKKSFTFWFNFTLLFILSCSKTDSGLTEIIFWAMGAEGEQVAPLITRFEKQNPDIRVKVQSIPWSAAHEKLLTAFAGNSTPDVCQLGNTWIPEFQAIGALEQLDNYIRQSSVVDSSYFFPGIWNTNVINNKTWGIPWYVDTRLLFYRTDVLQQVGYDHPPQTWDQWLDISRKIKLLSTQPARKYAVFFSTIFNDWYVPVILILNNNGRLLTADNCQAAFDDPATIEALEFYIRFFKERLAIRNMSEVSNIFQGFSDGFFSMMVTGPWNVNEIRKRLPDFENRWGTAPMPAAKNRNSVAGGSSLVVFKSSQNPEAAFRFIEYFSRAEIQLDFFHITRDLPSVTAAWESDLLKNDKKISAFYQQLLHVVPTPQIAEWEQVAVKLQQYLEQVIYNRISLKEAIERLNDDVDHILQKRRWLMERNLLFSEN